MCQASATVSCTACRASTIPPHGRRMAEHPKSGQGAQADQGYARHGRVQRSASIAMPSKQTALRRRGAAGGCFDGHSPPRSSNEKCNEKFCPVRAGAVCPAPGCMPALAHPGADEAPSARASASTAPTAAASVVAKDAWSRATPLGVPVAGGYITLRNASSAPDRLINRVKQRTAGGIAVYPLACSAAACNMDWR